MPGLLRGMARTAVIAGTATAVSNRVSRRQGERWAREAAEQEPAYQDYPPPPQPVAAPVASAPVASTEDRIEQLKQLGELHAQGVLTDAEFAAEKAKVLAG